MGTPWLCRCRSSRSAPAPALLYVWSTLHRFHTTELLGQEAKRRTAREPRTDSRGLGGIHMFISSVLTACTQHGAIVRGSALLQRCTSPCRAAGCLARKKLSLRKQLVQAGLSLPQKLLRCELALQACLLNQDLCSVQSFLSHHLRLAVAARCCLGVTHAVHEYWRSYLHNR